MVTATVVTPPVTIPLDDAMHAFRVEDLIQELGLARVMILAAQVCDYRAWHTRHKSGKEDVCDGDVGLANDWLMARNAIMDAVHSGKLEDLPAGK